MPLDDAAFRAAVERVDKALVAVMAADLRDGTLFDMYIGTGVLVRLGGREMVFTAAHNAFVEGKPELEPYITVAAVHNLPQSLAVVMQPGGGAAGVHLAGKADARGNVDPDVAVLEIGPHAMLRSDRVPLTADEIGFVGPDVPGTVMVAGFPRAYVQHKPSSVIVASFGPQHALAGQCVAARVGLTVGRRHPNEPQSGRGLHLAWDGPAHDFVDGTPTEFPHAKGLSGGPVMALGVDGRLRLIGLVRSREDGDVWCEPALAAVHAIAGHFDPAVASAVRDLLTESHERWRATHG